MHKAGGFGCSVMMHVYGLKCEGRLNIGWLGRDAEWLVWEGFSD